MKIKQSRMLRREKYQAWLSIAPTLILIIIMCGYPLIQTIATSFTQWNGVGDPNPVGLKNYIDILSGSQFYLLLKNNFVFLLFIPIQIVIGTMIAVFINDEVPGWKVYRVVYYIPQVISAVIVGYLFMVMFGYEGPVNLMLQGLGVIKESIGWLESGTTARIVVLICLVWVNIGWQSLLSLGGLASIPPSLYEAAKLDGAGYWKRLFKITFPMLGRTIEYSCIVSVMWVFTGIFPYIFALTGGGPGYETATIDYMIYLKSFSANSQYGYASALAVLLIIIVLIFTVIQLRVSDKQNSWEG